MEKRKRSPGAGPPKGNQNARKDECRQRHQVTLSPHVAEYAKRIGDGQLSKGIELLVDFHRRANQ